MILAFSILLAIAVGLAAWAVALHLGGSGARALQERLVRLARAPGARSVDVERDERYSAVPWLDRVLRGVNLGQRLELLLYQAGMGMRVGVLVTLSGVLGMAGYLFGLATFHRLFPAVVLLALLAPAPYVYVVIRKRRRMKQFADHFPDALDLLVSGLRAGLSFTAALQVVAEESPEPVRSEFAVTVEEQALGLEAREALLNLTRRVDVLDLRFFVTAVLLQRETGGNLAEVLARSAALIRDRFRVLGDIRTFTAQGKLTAAILVALPIAVALFTFMTNPEYFRPMVESDGGQRALWLAAGLQALGVLVIVKIINIKV